MNPEIDTRQVTAVEVEVQRIYLSVFPRGNRSFIPMVFGWARDAFTGNYRDYLPIDARYHDFEHTLQGTLCMARLLRGYVVCKGSPTMTQRMFELGTIAILMHDTGYLKPRGDSDGTGAKYTLIHVNRSVEFAGDLLREKKGFTEFEIKGVQNMIRCTGVNLDLSLIPFQNDLERNAGFALGTADLLGQMAARDYVEKLPILYSEFAESARYNSGKGTSTGLFNSPEDLMRKTPLFWQHYVMPKIKKDFQSLYQFLQDQEGHNTYLERIEANLDVLRGKFSDRVAA